METSLQANERLKFEDGPVHTGPTAVIVTLVVSLAWAVALYWGTAVQVFDIWWRSETFAHGLVVLPICGWLIWMRRAHLLNVPISPSPLMFIPVGLAGFAWLLGQIANVNALSHAALAFLIIGSAIGLLGLRAARELSFPLAFVLFGVPIGEFLMPTLMHYTAEFTVFALRASGIPVYQEGLFFVIPSGRWSVVEACSGLRYLIASMMVGTLFAYLNFNGWKKRWLFVVASIVVPIIANWLRAYFIVMLGHLTDNQLAVGVDHLIYGWVFFGVIILLMFWVGSLFRDPLEKIEVQVESSPVPVVSKGKLLVRSLPVLLVLGLFPLILARIDVATKPYELELKAPLAADGWVMGDQVFYDYFPDYAGYRGRVYQSYHFEGGGDVGLFIAYYADQRQGQELVTWSNRITPADEDIGLNWRLVSRRLIDMPVGEIWRSVIRFRSQTLSIYHWYWSEGRLITRDELAKIKLATDRIMGRQDDAAFIAVLTPLEEDANLEASLVRRFLMDHHEEIRLILTNASEQR